MERNLAKPPIREAIIDIQFNFGSTPLDYHIFESVYEKIKIEYPKKQILKWGELRMEIKDKGSEPIVKTSGGENGYRFDSVDGTQVVQFRTNGFTFSKLNSLYPGWLEFNTEAKKMLDIYLDTVSPISATRIALRYINLIKIPEKSFELEKYFTISPIIPKELPQDIVSYLNRILLKDDKSDALCFLTQTIDPNTALDKENTNFIFDVDVFFQNVSLNPKAQDFWSKFDVLRDFKNKIFFQGLTEATKSLFI